VNEAHPNAAHATAAAHTILLADELRTLPSDERERALASIRLRDGALAREMRDRPQTAAQFAERLRAAVA